MLYFRHYHTVSIFLFSALFIIAMNYNTHYVGGQGLFLPFNASVWILATIFIFFVLSKLSFFNRIRLSCFSCYYALVVMVLLLPLTYSNIENIEKEYLTIFSVFGAFLFFLAVEQFNGDGVKQQLLKVLFVSTLVQSIWGLCQYYVIFEPSVLFFRADVGIPYGIFAQKNVFASYLSFGSLLSLYFFFKTNELKRLHFFLVFAVVVVNSHLTMLAEAETGKVVSLMALIIYLSYVIYSRKKYLLPLVLCSSALFFSFTPKQWFDVRSEQKVEAVFGMQSFGIRPVIYKLSTDLVAESPIRGHGIGSVHKEYLRVQGAFALTNPDYPVADNTVHVHNEPLQWMIQLGVVSGFAFLGLFLIWVYGLKIGDLNPNILLLALPFVGHSLLEFPFHHSYPHLFAFTSVLALAINRPGKLIKLSSYLSVVIVPSSLLISYKAVALMFATLNSIDALVEYKYVLREKSVEPLTKISPTSTFQRPFEHEVFQWKLRKAVAEGEIPANLLFPFISWAEQQIGYAPFKLIYIQLTQSYMLANDMENAKRVIAEAHHIFPTDDEVSGYYYKLHPQP